MKDKLAMKPGENIITEYATPPIFVQTTPAGYEELKRVLDLALQQSANGKGKERHAVDRPFTDQPIMLIQEMVGPGFALGQAVKKIQESCRMDTESAKQELLGAIVYLAAAYLQREKDAL